MKIPYVKIYTADLLAKARKLSPEQIGRAMLGLCEQAFENQTAYKPRNEDERAFYEMLLGWKNASVSVIKSRKKAGRKGGLATQSKLKLSDGSNASPLASSKNFSLLFRFHPAVIGGSGESAPPAALLQWRNRRGKRGSGGNSV